jgi:hypothetical protein
MDLQQNASVLHDLLISNIIPILYKIIRTSYTFVIPVLSIVISRSLSTVRITNKAAEGLHHVSVLVVG